MDMKILGGYGKTSTPIEAAFSIYKSGYLKIVDMANIPVNFVTNGRISLESSPTNTILGHVRLLAYPTIIEHWNLFNILSKWAIETPLYDKGDMKGPIVKVNTIKVDKQVTVNNVDVEVPIRTLDSILELEKPLEFTEVDNTSRNIREQIVPSTNAMGFTSWQNKSKMFISYDDMWMNETISSIQDAFTNIARFTGSFIPEVKPIGYASFKVTNKGLKLIDRPGYRINFGTGASNIQNLASLQIMEDPFTITQERWYALYIWTLAIIMKDLFDKLKSDATMEDWFALATFLLYEYKGMSDISIKRTFTAYDVMDIVKHFIGIGIFEANMYMPKSNNNDWKVWWSKYLRFCIFFGLTSQRISAIGLNGVILRERGLFQTAADRFSLYNRPQLENFGTIAEPYFFMPKNHPGDLLWLPAAFNKDGINRYEINKQRKFNYVNVEIRHGEAMSEVFNPLEETEKMIIPILHEDAMIRTVDLPTRTIQIVEIPIQNRWDGIINDENNEDTDFLFRQLSMLYGLLSNRAAAFKDGYITTDLNVGYYLEGISVYMNRYSEPVIVDKSGQERAVLPNATPQVEIKVSPGTVKTPADVVPVETDQANIKLPGNEVKQEKGGAVSESTDNQKLTG